ncbi:aspartate aminotransferase family protein [Pseudenhygromyxa sp. WMMC2535]|uniref:aspartate aminotransferase family protein n=1 Tax=Pseudenhygromyxa sp. WMMC2535 TaxID=2712867 RepID=UPI0015581C50|nr:aminotransferase class III-fold pyridoxal phosphate-dependent enzyme [Pseudenhygromyxa sp. WMMC2535]NVB37514.1 aspartate aminotransferase family protein [Pseudenhygromyxa sp. WMMC2535]
MSANAPIPPQDLRWPTYQPGRGVTLEAAVFDEGRSGGALRVRDSAGKVYLDAIAGIGSAVLGHAHPRWLEALSRQLETLAAVANTFVTAPQQQLAARLAELFPIKNARPFFANSGTEATEAALKLALRATGRDVIIAFERAFHGRTLGAIALTANPAYRDPFVTCLGEDHQRFASMNVLRLPFDDLGALEAAFSEYGPRVAGVFVEPIQGEGGIWPASKAFLLGARALCDRHGALLGVDEIQSGFGRTGYWSAWESIVGDEAQPDILWLAKALGNGFPIGACLASEELAAHMGPGTHGTTFGGNPAACVAALATSRIIEEEQLLASAAAQLPTLRRIAEQSPNAEVVELRGAGAMIGVQVGALDAGRAKVLGPALQEAGVLVTTPGGHTLRLLLPYAAGEAELREFWAALAATSAANPAT